MHLTRSIRWAAAAENRAADHAEDADEPSPTAGLAPYKLIGYVLGAILLLVFLFGDSEVQRRGALAFIASTYADSGGDHSVHSHVMATLAAAVSDGSFTTAIQSAAARRRRRPARRP